MSLGVVLKSNIKLVLLLQKHYIHCTLKPDDVFLKSILYLYIYIYVMEHESKNLKNKLKFGVYCPRHFVSPVFCQHGVWWPVIRLLTSMIHNQPITMLVRNMCYLSHTHIKTHTHTHTHIHRDKEWVLHCYNSSQSVLLLQFHWS